MECFATCVKGLFLDNKAFIFAPLAEQKDISVNKNDSFNAAQAGSDTVVAIPAKALTYSLWVGAQFTAQRQLHSDSHCCWLTAGGYDAGGEAVLNVYHVSEQACTISPVHVCSISIVTCKNNDDQLQPIGPI